MACTAQECGLAGHLAYGQGLGNDLSIVVRAPLVPGPRRAGPRPELLFLDEPTAGLGPEARRDLHDVVRRLADREQATTVLTMHDIEYVIENDAKSRVSCDKVIWSPVGREMLGGRPGGRGRHE